MADVTRMNPSWVSSAGDMISTTKDLHTFVSALMGGRFLPAPLLAEMRTPRPKSGDFRYGLGLFVEDTDCGGTVFHHNGGFAGWAALTYSTPDGSTALTASLTIGDADLDFAAAAQVFEKAKQRLVTEVFCGGRAEPTGEGAAHDAPPPSGPLADRAPRTVAGGSLPPPARKWGPRTRSRWWRESRQTPVQQCLPSHGRTFGPAVVWDAVVA